MSAKLRLLGRERLHLAIHGSTVVDREKRIGSLGSLLGGVVTLCMDRDCHSVINGYAGAGL